MIVLLLINTLLLFAILLFLAELSRRLGNLEESDARQPVVPAPEPRPTSAPPRPLPEVRPSPPLEPPAPPATPLAVPTPPRIAPPATISRPSIAAVPAPAPAPEPVAAGPAWFSEENVGGAWLQNVGSVVVLLGVFFLFLWGYTTGRFGPGVLVAGGVALGGVLVWRGDRTIPGLPGFGHALVGIGLGVAYLSLYAGHFVLDVFGMAPAIVLLAVASLLSIGAAMRYRVQLIGLLGVLGAFVPWIAATFTGRPAENGSDAALLAYLFAIDSVVFILAARAGWSTLSITATLLTTTTWIIARSFEPWSTPVQLGLCALYLGLGLALVPRYISGASSGRSADLFSIALTPYCFVIASLPFLFAAPAATSAWILGGMAAAYAACAIVIDRRRPQRDLWSHFVVAASAFLAAALERALGSGLTPMAWCVQGVTMIALGLSPGGGALRTMGYLLATLGITCGMPALNEARVDGFLPVFTPASLRTAVSIVGLLLAARLLERHRDRLLEGEASIVPPAALIGVHACLAVWLGMHMGRISWSIVPPDAAPGLRSSLGGALDALGWALQGGGLVLIGLRGNAMKRALGYVVWSLAAVAAIAASAGFGAWTASTNSPLHALALTLAEVLLLGIIVTERADRARARLYEMERLLPRLAACALHAGWLAWTSAESVALARALAPPADVAIVSAGFTSAAWLFQAVTVFGLGWMRRSAFLRWLGIATLGLTLVKFLLVDLGRVDGFWRFVTAIAVGCALLAISYLYQRRRRADASGLASPAAPATLRPHEHSDDRADPPRP